MEISCLNPADSRADGRTLLVVDTNVLIGGLLMTDAADPLARVVASMRAGRVAFAVSPALRAEYREVLLRPKLVRRHCWPADVVDALIDGVCARAAVLAPSAGPRAPDPGDQMLWDLLAAHPGVRLVTLDRALLRDRGMIGRVVTAAAVAQRLDP